MISKIKFLDNFFLTPKLSLQESLIKVYFLKKFVPVFRPPFITQKNLFLPALDKLVDWRVER